MSKDDSDKKIISWIRAAKVAKQFKRKPFFYMLLQWGFSDGNFFLCVCRKNQPWYPIADAVHATPRQIKSLQELGVKVIGA